MKREIQNIEGVHSVEINGNVKRVAVRILLNELSFGYFQTLAAKEIELFDKYPDVQFDFDILPVAALQETSPSQYAA